jgi:DNA mismatch endonuclease (patch repair protein)
VRRRDTGAEVRLRTGLWALGMRYRVDQSCVGPYRPDVVFSKARVAVFVDGCFWHKCPMHATMPARNHDWWAAKLAANSERDARANDALQEAGYLVLRVWEHEDPAMAALRIRDAVRARRPARASLAPGQE